MSSGFKLFHAYALEARISNLRIFLTCHLQVYLIYYTILWVMKIKMSVNEKTVTQEELKSSAVDFYLTSVQLGAALTDRWLEENEDGTYKEYDYSGNILSKHVIVKEPLFFECTICDKREPYCEEQADLQAWNFGADLNSVEADGDGGIRGTHIECAKETERGKPNA